MAKSRRKTGLKSRSKRTPPAAEAGTYFEACAVNLPPRSRLGLLDLPAETRLLIYPHLLVSEYRKNDPKVLEQAQCNPSWVRVSDRSSRNERLGPSTVELKNCKGYRANCDLWPEILCTCRLIYTEASPFLSYYGEQAFCIPLRPQDEAWRQEDLMRHCPQLFAYSEEQWQDLQVPEFFQSNLMVAFLAKAGAQNASQISNMKFCAADCDTVGDQTPLITELVRLHMPGLRKVEIHVAKKEVFYDESPDYFHPDRSSPFWMNGLFNPMYNALVDFVDKVSWLKIFKYSGQDDFGTVDQGPVTGWHRLRDLEIKVRNRFNADTLNDDFDEKTKIEDSSED